MDVKAIECKSLWKIMVIICKSFQNQIKGYYVALDLIGFKGKFTLAKSLTLLICHYYPSLVELSI